MSFDKSVRFLLTTLLRIPTIELLLCCAFVLQYVITPPDCAPLIIVILAILSNKSRVCSLLLADIHIELITMIPKLPHRYVMLADWKIDEADEEGSTGIGESWSKSVQMDSKAVIVEAIKII